MMNVYVVFGEQDYYGDQLIDLCTSEYEAREKARRAVVPSGIYDSSRVEKWTVAPGQESTVDHSYDVRF